VPSDYEAESDSAFEVPSDYEAESDSAFEVPSDYEAESDSAFAESALEKRILETREVSDTDTDGVRVLRPVNRFSEKRDPVANTLNMFKRESKNVTKDGDK
jgi:hypothetical protein